MLRRGHRGAYLILCSKGKFVPYFERFAGKNMEKGFFCGKGIAKIKNVCYTIWKSNNFDVTDMNFKAKETERKQYA
jgi:hypothetical protein